MPNDYGVLTEQGFVVGNGLGFNPLSEQENKHLEDENEDKETGK